MTKKNDSPIEAIEDKIEQEAKELKREYKRFEKFRNENSLLFGVFVLGVTALVVINTIFWVQYTSQRYQDENEHSATIASLTATTSLQTAKNFAVSAKVSNVGTTNKVDRAFTLAADETLLTMDISMTNLTSQTQHLIPVSQFYIRGTEGEYAELHASSFVKSPLAAQNLKPGTSATGQLSFAVPKSLERPLLYIDTAWDNSTPLVIDVLN